MAIARLDGAGNCMQTIVKGMLPLEISGPVDCGLRNGILAAPARAAQAASPLIFGLLIDWLGVGALAISAGMSIAALLALMGLRARTAPAAGAAGGVVLFFGRRAHPRPPARLAKAQ